jgi:hypothetical protein
MHRRLSRKDRLTTVSWEFTRSPHGSRCHSAADSVTAWRLVGSEERSYRGRNGGDRAPTKLPGGAAPPKGFKQGKRSLPWRAGLGCRKDGSAERIWRGLGTQEITCREVKMLDLFYIGVVIAFFVVLWEFTRASEHL